MKEDTAKLPLKDKQRKHQLWNAIEKDSFDNHEPAPSSSGKTIDDYTLEELEKYLQDNQISIN